MNISSELLNRPSLKAFILLLVQQQANSLNTPLYFSWHNEQAVNRAELEGIPTDAIARGNGAGVFDGYPYRFICSTAPLYQVACADPWTETGEAQYRFNSGKTGTELITGSTITFPQFHGKNGIETWTTDTGFAYVLMDGIPMAAAHTDNILGMFHLEHEAGQCLETAQDVIRDLIADQSLVYEILSN